MFRVAMTIAGLTGTLVISGAASARAQTWAPNTFPDASPEVGPTITAQLNSQSGFRSQDTDTAIGPPLGFSSDFALEKATPTAATSRRDIWIERGSGSDRLTLEVDGQLRRADGSPLPARLNQASLLDAETYNVRYIRGFAGAHGRTPSGLEVSLTPHAGLGVGSSGGSAEAGATLRIGQGLNRLVPEGRDVFGERSRWYIYAAGSGRAVGYNFARNRDGNFDRSGYTHDEGTFIGDASVGVALRRGDVQTSIGLSYRELSASGFRGYDGIETDVAEGMIGFQLSIKP